MLSVFVLLLLAVVMGTASVNIVSRLSKEDSDKIVSQLCEAEKLRFDNKISLVQHSVNIIAEYASELQKVNGGMDVYSERFEQHIRNFTIAVANQTEGAVAVYFRYNPEITGSGTSGFFWSRHAKTKAFVENPPTDILAYAADDVEHVGWYYIPKETGKPLWMKPYFNQNIGVFMISYVAPLYLSDGEFAGVIGMDIDFKSIINETEDMQIYRSGTAAWIDPIDRRIYDADRHGFIQKQSISEEFYAYIMESNDERKLLKITDDANTACAIYCSELSNGMLLCVRVPVAEINESRNRLMLLCVFITIIIFAMASAAVNWWSGQIVQPLKKLTEITEQYAKGDWSGQYIAQTGDEIQGLSEGIAAMARNTQGYINRLSSLARTDAATGLKNKTSYLEMVEDIRKNRHEKYGAYAVVSIDLNFLKMANDTYGHEAGDLFIKEAASYICKTFAHSPVYRTGGDEFVVIMYSEDYRNRHALMAQFEADMNYAVPGMEQLRLSLSFGMAAYPEDGAFYDRVFELADERMYQKKKAMRAERRDSFA